MIDPGVLALAEAKEAVIKKNRMKGMKIRDEFICPITYELMREPVVASDGHTYEKNAIEKWLKTSHTSPRNGDPIDGTIIPNYNLKKLIQDIINEGGSGFYTNDISNKDRVFDVSSEKVLVLECLGPPESDWNQQSFQVNRFGCIGGRKHNTEDNFQSKEIVLFKDITVSRRHFEITQQQDANVKNYYIRDLGSAGGTFVRIAYGTRKQLHPGMIILLGKHQFTVSSIDDSGGDTPRTPKVSARRHSSGTLRKSAFNSMYLMSLVENAEQLIADMSREEAAEDTEEGQKHKEELNARLKNLTITLSNHIAQEEDDHDDAAALQHVTRLAAAAHAEAKVIESKQAFYHHNDGSTANDLLMNGKHHAGHPLHHPHSEKKEQKCSTINESDDIETSTMVHQSAPGFHNHSPHAAMHSTAMHVTVGPKSTHAMNADGATDFPRSSKNNRCCTLTCCAPDGSPLQGKSFTVSTQGAVMGRKFTNGIALYMKVVDAEGEERIVNVDTAISGEHARVEYDAATGSFFICDGTTSKASTNGTWFRLSGPHQESPPHLLQASTEVLIGTVRFLVRESMTIAEHKVESRSFSAFADTKMSGIGQRTANTFNQPAPSNYVAGVGRGAMGFTTRSDIGPARPMAEAPVPGAASSGGFADPQFGVAPAGYVAGMGRGMGDLARSQSDGGGGSSQQAPADMDRGDYSESNYDEFSGYGERLFSANTPYDEDDAEADKIYDKVDNLMDSRRKRSREQQLLLQQKSARNGRPRIADQFADLKRELSTVSSAEWDAIPEVGDHSLKYKQSRKKETFTPAPDFLIESHSSRNVLNQQETSLGSATPSTGFASVAGGLAEARGIALSSKLDGMSDDVSGQTVVDPKGYLTSLESVKINSSAEVGDIKRARHLLHSVTTTNPKHGPGWIAAARVEEFASNMTQARKIITEGCLSCPDSEDVWLEAARLHNPDQAKKILANGARSIPKSVKIWLAAAELEGTNLLRKKAVLRKALEFIPGSVKLWKAAIGLENVNDARIMLARAVECVPESVEMWLALAKLETHENARKVLNEAREKNPTERLTWITAAKLEEAHGNNHLVDRIIEKMVVSLEQYDVAISRELWITEAEECEHSGAPLTCAAIIKCTIHLGVEEEDQRNTWMDDAETCLAKQPPSKETARAIYNYALSKYPTKKTLWQCAAMLEKEHGTPESLNAKLLEGVKHCPHGEVLWLMAAKERWLAGNVPAARDILLEAFNANPKSEQIWLAAIKLEWENGEFTRAQLLLSKAREHAPTERIYLKSALLEYEMADYPATIRLLEEAIGKYPSFAKYYLMLGQCLDLQLKEFVKARQVYLNGLKVCVNSVPLWRSLMMLEENVKGVLRARPTGEMARMKLPKNDAVWLECIRLERRSKNDKLADNLMAKALQECPTSDILLAEDLLTCVKTSQKSKCIEAMKKCPNNAIIFTTVARLLEKNHRILKARKYYVRALSFDARYGDAYVYYYICEYLRLHKKRLLQEGIMGGSVAAGSGSASGAADAAVTSSEEQGTEELDGIDDDSDDEENEEGEVTEALVAAATTGVSSAAAGGGPSEAELAVLASIVQKCGASNPNRGELWCSFTKSDVKLRRAEPATKLKATVEHVLGFKLSS